METLRSRSHLTHFEVPGAACHVTWRLQRKQSALSPVEREIVLGILKHAVAFGCVWHAAVVMDDHVHALATPGAGANSSRLIRVWKGASSRRLVKLCGRRAPVWQAEYYLRWIRSKEGVVTCSRYIRANPERRWPGIERYPWILP